MHFHIQKSQWGYFRWTITTESLTNVKSAEKRSALIIQDHFELWKHQLFGCWYLTEVTCSTDISMRNNMTLLRNSHNIYPFVVVWAMSSCYGSEGAFLSVWTLCQFSEVAMTQDAATSLRAGGAHTALRLQLLSLGQAKQCGCSGARVRPCSAVVSQGINLRTHHLSQQGGSARPRVPWEDVRAFVMRQPQWIWSARPSRTPGLPWE
jgi:hypothetical protein